MKKRAKKRQLGGFTLPPSLMGLFSGDEAPSFDAVMALAPQLDAGAGTDVFSRAFAEDNPDLILGETMSKASRAEAFANNPGQDPAEVKRKIDQQVDIYTRNYNKRRTAVGGHLNFSGMQPPDVFRKQLEEQAAQNGSANRLMNTLLGKKNLQETTSSFNQADQLFGLLDTWLGQQGGTPFGPQEMPNNKQLPKGKISLTEALQLTADDDAFIKGLKDDSAGRATVLALLADMGFDKASVGFGAEDVGGEKDEDLIKIYKEIQGLNSSPKRGADNKMDAGFLDYLAKHYKHFQFEQWGLDPSELRKMADGGKAILGYSDNSPFKYLPEINIPGNNITMENTGIPLIGVPDVGSPKIMQPYSGEHNFPGASNVKEMPVMKKGGRKKTRRIPYYQPGGSPGQEQEQAAPPMAVQLEEGEVFSTPELDIIDANAREKHKDMKEDLITDVMRGEDYVFSADPKMVITRKRAEDVSFGLGAVHYKEGEIGEIPEEITAADIMDDDIEEMIIADYVKEIRKKYPVSDRDDVFSRKTNEANKSSRIPYLAAGTLFNEEKRTKGKAPMTGFVSNFENKFEDQYTSGSGVDMTGNQHVAFGEIGSFQETPVATAGEDVRMGQKGGNMTNEVPHGQFGLDAIGQLVNFATSLFGIGAAKKQGKIAQKTLQADRPQINKLARTEGLHSDLSYGAQMAGLVGQDPTVQAPNYDSTELDATPRNVSPALFQIAAARAMAGNRPFLDTLFKNTSDFSEAANAYSSAHAPALGVLADLGMGEVEKNLAMETDYRARKQDFNDRQELADVTAANATTTNANQLTGALGNTMGAAISSRGRIAANRINALRQNSLQQGQAKIDASAAMTAAVQNAGASAANTGFYLANRNDIDNNVDVSGAGAGTTAGGGITTSSGTTYTPQQVQALMQLLDAIEKGKIKF